VEPGRLPVAPGAEGVEAPAPEALHGGAAESLAEPYFFATFSLYSCRPVFFPWSARKERWLIPFERNPFPSG